MMLHSPGIPVRHWRTHAIALALALSGLVGVFACAPAWAANTDAPASAQAAAPHKGTTSAGGPTWNELNASQRAVLEPIASLWNDLSEVRKRKWLLIAKNYPGMSAVEQAKLRERMTEWASLTRQQRDQARQNYQVLKKVPADQRAAQWEAYQALSADEKRQFAQRAPAQPTGLATVSAGRPALTPKLSAVPRRHALLNAHAQGRPTPAASAVTGDTTSHTDATPTRSPYEDEPAN